MNIKEKRKKCYACFTTQKRDVVNMKNRDDSFFSTPAALAQQSRSEYSTQSGRSMVEMLGVLAIIGVLSVGGIAGYSKAMWQMKINKDIEIIIQTVANMQTLYASQTGECKYGGGSYECDEEGCECPDNNSFDSIQEIVMPDEITTNWTLPTGGYIRLYYVGIYRDTDDYNNNRNTRGIDIYIYQASKEECIALATYDWGSRTTGLIGYSVGNDYMADVTDNIDATYGCQGKIGNVGIYSMDGALACPGGSVVGVPMPVSVATNACSGCDPDFGCVIEFIFE